MGSDFPAGAGPRVVYLDERYDYPPQESDDFHVERSRQMGIWRQLMVEGGAQFLDRQVEGDFPDRDAVCMKVQEEIGHRYSAEFYERVFSTIFRQDMNVVIIATGVTAFTGDNYHEIGYLQK